MLGKKGNFNQIVKWMMERAKEGGGEANAPKGDACCGGGEPKTPDAYIAKFLPSMTESLIEILADAPFHMMNVIN